MTVSRRILAAAVVLCSLFVVLQSATAQGTAFSYQGRLVGTGGPANGLHDFRFSLWTASGGGSQIGVARTNLAVAVTNGLFMTGVDFGSVFAGQDSWLEIGARTNGGVAWTFLNPRQRLTPTPYAMTASNLTGVLPATRLSGTLPSAQLSGTYAGAVTFNNAANTYSGSGSGLTGLNASQLASGTAPASVLSNAWRTTGNVGTLPANHFVGTIDDQPLEFKVNNSRALRLEPCGGDGPNIIGGYSNNTVGASTRASTIGGGGSGGAVNSIAGLYSTIAGGRLNGISDNATDASIGGGYGHTIRYASFATIGGGRVNTIQWNAEHGTISGGHFNTIQTNAVYATIAGGYSNTVWAYATNGTIGGGHGNVLERHGADSVIGGGKSNTVRTGTRWGTIAGGYNNAIHANAAVIGGGNDNRVHTGAVYSTISGGRNNSITNSAPYATIPGGVNNSAEGHAFAAGRRAKAYHVGSFVWGDSVDSDVVSLANNSVTFRASGGVRFLSNVAMDAGVSLAAGGTAWASISDRNAKKNFAAVDGQEVLDRLASMPMQRWNYRWEADGDVPHIGPMAQDFKAAFYPGRDDKSITTLELDGVALAAIQGLNERLKEKDAQLAAMEERLAALEQQLQTRDGVGP